MSVGLAIVAMAVVAGVLGKFVIYDKEKKGGKLDGVEKLQIQYSAAYVVVLGVAVYFLWPIIKLFF